MPIEEQQRIIELMAAAAEQESMLTMPTGIRDPIFAVQQEPAVAYQEPTSRIESISAAML